MKLTKNSQKSKKERIEEIANKVAEIQLKKDSLKKKDGVRYELAEKEQQALLLLLKNEINELESAKIISELELPDNIVSVGDTLTLLTKLNNDPEETETITLVEEFDPNQSEYITINSPLGNALYLQKVGSQLICNIPAGSLKITILEKTKGLKR